MRTSPESRLVLWGFGLSLVILAGIGTVTYQTNVQVLEAAEWRARSLGVFQLLEAVLSGLSNAESEQRGYVITGSRSYLDAEGASVSAVRRTMLHLRDLVSDNPAQARRVARLAPLIDERIARLEGGIRARESGGFATAQATILSGQGSRLMHDIDALVGVMKKEEARLLEERENAVQASGSTATRAAFGGAFATMLIVSVVFVLLRRQVAARRRSAESLRNQTNLLRSIVDSMADGLVVADRDGAMVLCNEAAERILGGGTGDAPADAWGSIHGARRSDGVTPFPDDETPLVRAIHGAPSDDVEMFVPAPGSTEGSFISVTGRPLRDSAGAITGGVAVFHDVTAERRSREEMRQAREAAEAASRAKSEFVANVSHEIRTPLNGVLGMLDLALETPLDEEQTRYLTTAHAAARSLVELISDLLDFAKIEAGKLVVDATDFRLREMLGDTLAQFAPQIQGKELDLACQVDPDVPDAICGDPGRLRQILVNLVGNAIKFTEQGEIVVRVRRDGSGDAAIPLQFLVTDTGIGIPADRQAHVFQPFTQADGSTTRRYGGTGLGLTICARLTRLMGGTIDLESRPRHGTTVRVSLPFAAATTSGRDEIVGEVGDLRGIEILVADDGLLQRSLLGDMLTSSGLRAQVVADGAAAFAALRERAAAGAPFALLVTDVRLADMDGFHLVERLRDNPDLAETPVIMTTSAGQRGDAARCRALGIAAYLAKPFRQSDMQSALLAALSARPAQVAETGPLTRHTLRVTRRRLDVLLAEDNEFNLAYMLELLRKQGALATVVRNGSEAVERCMHKTFDLVLMDVQMPGMDGLQATAAIRSHERGGAGRVPIIALTARATEDDRRRCLEAGMDGYLPKPIRARDLLDAIDKVLGPEPAGSSANGATAAGIFAPGGAGTAAGAVPGAAAAGAEEDDPLNVAAILAEVDGDRDLLNRMIGLFQEAAAGHMIRIREAIRARDARALDEAAHALKGMVGYWCRGRAFKAAERLEEGARRGDLGGSAADCASLERELPRLSAQLGRLSSEARVA